MKKINPKFYTQLHSMLRHAEEGDADTDLIVDLMELTYDPELSEIEQSGKIVTVLASCIHLIMAMHYQKITEGRAETQKELDVTFLALAVTQILPTTKTLIGDMLKSSIIEYKDELL